jgi:hypothetical protein
VTIGAGLLTVIVLIGGCRAVASRSAAPATYKASATALFPKAGGYRGIWFTLGQRSEFGDKYSGGLGTYTANHVPIAIYSPAVNKTFFVYGGTIKGERHLLIMASYFDHVTGTVPRPTVVHDKNGVNDPHDNAAISIDADGYIWIFVSGRARVRPGFIYRSARPYDIDSFEQISKLEITYPQPHFIGSQGFFHLFTKYTAGRELYFATSADGRTWSPDQKLAGFGGHYQVSHSDDKKIASAFMWHPGGNVDKRTNLYYAQTIDFGKTWTTAAGVSLKIPLDDPKNFSLVIDYQSQGSNVYIHDLNFDARGNPVILYLTSKGAQPGPNNGARVWKITRWDGAAWQTTDVCESDHNYDTGSLYILPDRWLIIGPTDPGPQPPGAGGEMVLWTSTDQGKTWSRTRAITHDSRFNHSYARRPDNARDPFFAFWADGDPNAVSESRLYFTNSIGDRVWQLPYDMKEEFATPKQIGP